MLSAVELGVDDRAQELLAKLPADHQQAILQKLTEESGKVRNVSAYVASACNKTDVSGIDERAADLLKQLPKHQQKEVMDKLRTTEGINNPSAWVAKACMKAGSATPQFQQQQQMAQQMSMFGNFGKYGGKGGYGQQIAYWEPVYMNGMKGGKGGYGKGGMPAWQSGKSSQTPQIDANAEKLVSSLPGNVRNEIMAKLREESHSIRNPSAWVVKAALKAGASTEVPVPLGDGDILLDAEAEALLNSLPEDEQVVITDKLTELGSSVRNPSAWVVKAALKAGAVANRRSLGLDPDAAKMLASLDQSQQDEIVAQLEETKPRNRSGWVVKAALNAGAKPQAEKGGKGCGKKGMMGMMRYMPY